MDALAAKIVAHGRVELPGGLTFNALDVPIQAASLDAGALGVPPDRLRAVVAGLNVVGQQFRAGPPATDALERAALIPQQEVDSLPPRPGRSTNHGPTASRWREPPTVGDGRIGP